MRTIFQQHARKPGLQPTKVSLLGFGQNEFVWWESEVPLATLSENPFAFGHTIVLATSAATGKARTYMSLFGSLHFGVAFGELDGLFPRIAVLLRDTR